MFSFLRTNSLMIGRPCVKPSVGFSESTPNQVPIPVKFTCWGYETLIRTGDMHGAVSVQEGAIIQARMAFRDDDE